MSWLPSLPTGLQVQGSGRTLIPQRIAMAVMVAMSLQPASSAMASQVSAVSEPEPEVAPLREAIACPTDPETLTPLLLRDVPSYANRVNQRTYPSVVESKRAGYILLASEAEFDPLTLGPGAYTTAEEQPVEDVVQIFFTTLERQYVSDGFVNLQYHHWLFLTQVDQDWRVVTLVSQLTTVPEGQLLSPPEDTGQGIIAQAIRLWLRDCRYRAIAPMES